MMLSMFYISSALMYEYEYSFDEEIGNVDRATTSRSNQPDVHPNQFNDIFIDETDSGSELDISEDEENVVEFNDPFAESDTQIGWNREDEGSPTFQTEHLLSPPPINPVTSPSHRNEHSCILLYTRDDSVTERDEFMELGSERIERRGYPRTRGLRARGGNRGRGRRSTLNALNGGNSWQRGDPLIEICINDEDVPQALRDSISQLLDRRRARKRQLMRRSRTRNNENGGTIEHNDASSEVANELFEGDNNALNFEWSPMESFQGIKEPFTESNSGPNGHFTSGYEAFRQIWDDDILEHIVKETNRYASNLKSSDPRFERKWYDTNVHEILILFCFWMMLGIIKMPTIASCFTKHALLKTDIFRVLFTRNRYWMLNKALHFVNNNNRNSESSRLFCIEPILDHLNHKFMSLYTPSQDVTIDESLTLWKGNLSFKQFMKTKAAKFGIKTFELCESATGYLWSFFIYLGKNSPSSLPKSTQFVIELIRPLLNKGYRLFLDNWFNSPVLARFLKRNKTDCVGTLRKCRQNVPPIIQLSTIPEGHIISRHSGDVVVTAYQDKKTIYMISTHHGTENTQIGNRPGRPSHYKPQCVLDYNKGMGGVDRKDQILEPYLIERKRCKKWYKKMFKRLLNVSIFNSRILAHNNNTNEKNQLAFRLELVNQIITIHLNLVPQSRSGDPTNRNHDLPLNRLVGKHFPTKISGMTAKVQRQYCIWCRVRVKKYSKTSHKCAECNVPLCLNKCFKKYHTLN